VNMIVQWLCQVWTIQYSRFGFISRSEWKINGSCTCREKLVCFI